MKTIFHFINHKRSIAGMLATAIGFITGLSILYTVTSVVVVALGGGIQATKMICGFMVLISVPVALGLINQEWRNPLNSALGPSIGLLLSALLVGIFIPALWVAVLLMLRKQSESVGNDRREVFSHNHIKEPSQKHNVAPSIIRQIEQIFSDRLEEGKHLMGA